MCAHRMLDDPNGLLCDNEACDGRSHTYSSSTASQLGEGRGHREPKGDEQ